MKLSKLLITVCVYSFIIASTTMAQSYDTSFDTRNGMAKGQAALLAKWPQLVGSEDSLQFSLEFDCKEASLIDGLDNPVLGSENILKTMSSLISKLPFDFIKNSLDILAPYCRSDNDYYGQFCMAADIEAAKDLFQDSLLLSNLPAVVLAVGDAIDQQLQINIYDIAYKTLHADTKLRSHKAARLAGFIGLDDNGVQFDRLKADLLKYERWNDYASIFPASSQNASLPLLT